MSSFLRQRSANQDDAAAIKRADFRSLMEDFFGAIDAHCKTSWDALRLLSLLSAHSTVSFRIIICTTLN